VQRSAGVAARGWATHPRTPPSASSVTDIGQGAAQRGAYMAHRKATLAATCHCGAIRIHVSRVSRTLTSCNCSICRRYGALWAYYAASSVKIEAPKGGISKYSWNRKIRVYYRCKKCGCITHCTYRKKHRNTTVAVNAVNFEPSALVGARIRHLDGAASWKFLDRKPACG
jgi:hypothetical protein